MLQEAKKQKKKTLNDKKGDKKDSKKEERMYSLSKNFISLSSYLCMELNAHGLLNLVFKCI